MKISADDQKGISVILIYMALLFFLIGIAGWMKAEFHCRQEILTAGILAAAVCALLGAIVLVIARRGSQ